MAVLEVKQKHRARHKQQHHKKVPKKKAGGRRNDSLHQDYVWCEHQARGESAGCLASVSAAMTSEP